MREQNGKLTSVQLYGVCHKQLRACRVIEDALVRSSIHWTKSEFEERLKSTVAIRISVGGRDV